MQAQADLESALAEADRLLSVWDDAGNPEHPQHADQRIAYMAAVLQFLRASGAIEIGAFSSPDLAGEAIKLRGVALQHALGLESAWEMIPQE